MDTHLYIYIYMGDIRVKVINLSGRGWFGRFFVATSMYEGI